MNDYLSLFEEEERLAEESRAFLDSAGLQPEAYLIFHRLLDGYGKLLRETKQLIRLSDRKEKDFNRLNHKLQQLTQSLSYKADHDAMTACLNKGAMTELINSTLLKGDLCLILLDIDHFKRVNDDHGHPAGDAVLRGVADILHEQAGVDEWIGRMGGEEFAILLPHRSLLQCRSVAENVRRTVENARFEIRATHLSITVSAGLAASRPGEDFAGIYQRVDSALYQAKQSGRNRVVLSD